MSGHASGGGDDTSGGDDASGTSDDTSASARSLHDERPGSARSLRRDVRGLSTTEYVIALGLIAIAGWLTWQTFGDHLDFGVRSGATVMLEDD